MKKEKKSNLFDSSENTIDATLEINVKTKFSRSELSNLDPFTRNQYLHRAREFANKDTRVIRNALFRRMWTTIAIIAIVVGLLFGLIILGIAIYRSSIS
ncbi:hypothetical protein E1I18_00310 [Mycoplasmopsis mucosicanis]|uniref:Uncharacterized protein n=1 Tax=Mycoplasmopsis mucosicanis TaxID=458208 RepID=A0A507SSZ0_9BACT|nr:hypothetical protein [Mycoplasmopsis mucosicanis]TQC54206.1 hypothetical protein E1I18_00310 [Mycoplasmopsis mucosicanis]